MDYFTVLPIIKRSTKSIEIIDENSTRIGYIKRKYKSTFELLKNVIPFLETTNLLGESDQSYIEIKEQSFKSTLYRLKWDYHLTDKSNQNNKLNFLLENKTKISTIPRFLLTKDNKSYVFKKDIFSRSCKIYCNDTNRMCAEINLEKWMPASAKVSVYNDDLEVVEVLGVFHIMNLIY